MGSQAGERGGNTAGTSRYAARIGRVSFAEKENANQNRSFSASVMCRAWPTNVVMVPKLAFVFAPDA